MKRNFKLIIIVVGIAFILLCSLLITGQEVKTSISQDFRLLVTKDILGNSPPQPDIILSADVYFKYINTGINYEYANVGMDFHRVSVSVGAHYEYKKFIARQSFNYGLIIRPFGRFGSWGTHSSLGYNFGIVEPFGMIQVTQRSEWGDMIRWSGFIGLRFIVFNIKRYHNNSNIQIKKP